MSLSLLGTYSATGSKTTGAQSKTDVTIPSGATIAIVSMHYWDSSGTTVAPGAPTLDSQTGTEIVSYQTDGTQNSVRAWRVSGFSSGASKTLAWTNSNNLASGVGIRISFYSGEHATPIGGTGSNGNQNGNVDFSGLTWSSGDWTIIATSSDNSGVLLDGGANTEAVAESASDGLYCGQAYRTDAGAIGTPSSTNSYLGAVAFVLKAAAGGAAAGFGPLLAPMRNRRVLP